MTPPVRPACAVVLSLLALLALGAPTTPAAAQEQRTTLPLATYLEMESVSDPQISPGGRRIVYTRGWMDKVNDRRATYDAGSP